MQLSLIATRNLTVSGDGITVPSHASFSLLNIPSSLAPHAFHYCPHDQILPSRCLFKLAVVKLCIETALYEQFLVAAAFNDIPIP